MKITMLSAVAVAMAAMAVPASITAATPATPATAAKPAQDALTQMFVWWNAAYKDKNGFTKAAFETHFTPDAVMFINGRESARGIQDLAEHFQEIQKKTQAVAIELPFIETFQSPDHKRIFTYHVVTSMADGKAGRDLVMGYADVVGGRISKINFVSAEPAPPRTGK